MENNTVGTIIKNARIVKGYSQEYLASLCGISYEHICRIEHGRVKKLRPSTFNLICKALNLDLSEVLKESDCSKEEKSLASIIKNARIAKGYSQRDLSNACEMAQASISSIELGNTLPLMPNLKLICDILDIDFDKLLEEFHYNGYSSEKKSLASTIKNARLTKVYSQRYLSKLCGVSCSQINHIETGKSIPRASTLKKICAALSLDFEEVSKLS